MCQSIRARLLVNQGLKVLLERLVDQISFRLNDEDINFTISAEFCDNMVVVDSDNKSTKFDLLNKIISGEYSKASSLAKDQLRRNGIRFRYENLNGFWTSWDCIS